MRDQLRATTRGYYDVQKLRIQIGGRIIANFKSVLGQNPSQKESDLDEREKDVLKTLRKEYKNITDGAARLPTRKRYKGTKLISDYTNFIMIANHASLIQVEDRLYKEIEYILDEFEIYNRFLKSIKGCGVAMSAVIISEIDISRAEHPSSIHKYAGVDVAEDGRGRSKRKEHLIEKKYINKKGEKSKRKSITYNPWLKTKLLGVLGPSFLKQKNEPYSNIYYQYKHRLEHHIKYKKVSKGHRHNMAVRYMIKRFLVDLYLNWREFEGLPVSEEYSVAKLGLIHHKAA